MEKQWIITLTNGTKVSSNDVKTAHVVAVMQLSQIVEQGGNAWAATQPASSPTILASWVAVLEAELGQVQDVGVQLQRIMQLPIKDLMNMYDEVESPQDEVTEE